jgi:hypothetical protein
MLLAVALPLAGGLGIAAAHKWPNLREFVSLATAVALALVVWGMLPAVMAGARPEAALLTLMPGISIRLAIEPLGAMFAALASLLWIINTVYSIGYMRGNQERHQTRYYIFFAVAIAATMGIALAGNLVTLFIFYEMLTLSTSAAWITTRAGAGMGCIGPSPSSCWRIAFWPASGGNPPPRRAFPPSGERPSFPAVHRQVLVWLFQDVVLWLMATNQIAHFLPRRI